tara:strand:- start:1266 stop:1910 length:645 start_codon:yes stop_codon:yes gene_type:complete
MAEKKFASTRDSTLTFLLREGSSSASTLAGFLGISVQAMRRQLRNLEIDGLVASAAIAIGPGRPSNLWQLTFQGQNLFNNSTGNNQFALDLLNSIEDKFNNEGMHKLLSHQTTKKVNSYRRLIGKGKLSIRLQKLVELRNAEGYLAEIHPCSDGSKSWFLKAFHCSIRKIAEKYPIVCDHELELFRTVFDDCKVSRVHWRIESGHSCGFQITPN